MDSLRAVLAEALKNRNIKPSYNRIRIMEYLTINRNHPTVEEIHSDLVEEIPTLSKTTVYNSLNTFVEAGLVREISIGDNEARYDADTSDHGHFKCEVCGRIYDFPADLVYIKPKTLEGFKVTQRDIYFKGICSRCLDNK